MNELLSTESLQKMSDAELSVLGSTAQQVFNFYAVGVVAAEKIRRHALECADHADCDWSPVSGW